MKSSERWLTDFLIYYIILIMEGDKPGDNQQTPEINYSLL